MSAPTKFRIHYIHQVPGKPFTREVSSVDEGKKILDVVYAVMLDAFDKNQIPDYCNAGGVEYLDSDGEWTHYDEGDEEWWDQ